MKSTSTGQDADPSLHPYSLELERMLRSDEPRLGHLPAAIAYKKALVEKFGAEQAFRVVRSRVNVPDIDLLRRRSVVSLRSAASDAPFMNELWNGGSEFTIEPPVVIGEGDHTPLRGRSRSAFLTMLEDVSIRGRSSVVLTRSHAILDFEGDELQRFEDNPELDPAVLCSDGQLYHMMEPSSVERVVDEAFFLCGKYTHDFGHWLTEYLPRLAIAMLAGLPPVPILVDEKMPSSHVQAVQLMIPDVRIVTIPHLSPCRVRRLWCAPNPVYRGYYPASWISAWPHFAPHPKYFATAIGHITYATRTASRVENAYERLYLARRPERKKRLLNHDVVEGVARARGFHVLYPEDHSFLAQLRLVRNARFIVAPDGSNGLLSYYARPGAHVCFLNSTNTLPLVELNGILAALGVTFTIVTGPMHGPDDDEKFWNDYEIDPNGFDDFLAGWLSTAESAL